MFWSRWQPARLVRADLFPRTNGVDRQDATRLPYRDETFDAVVIDPPYKLNGTDQGEGERYGVAEYASAEGRHRLMQAMLHEGERVLRPARRDQERWVGGRLLFKCQAQVNGGRLRWQNYMAYEWGRQVGLVLVEQLDYLGGRPQPDRFRWRCRACGNPNSGPSHQCRQARPIPLDPDGGRPWLERYPSPQEHAYLRPSSLLIFLKEPR